jgi:uncharacterized protein
MTCAFRCGNACDHPVPNTSDNEYFGDVVRVGMSRRALLKAGAVTGLVVSVGGVPVTGEAAAANEPDAPGSATVRGIPTGSALTFSAVKPNDVDNVVVPNGYDWSPLVSWGDPVLPGAPAFDVQNQSAEAQRGSSGTTATSSPSCRCAHRIRRCSWSTTSTPTIS